MPDRKTDEVIIENPSVEVIGVSANGAPQKRTVDQTYWSLVKHQYKKNKLALAALYVVFFLIAIALLADFLANNKPIYAKYKGETYFPILKSYSVGLGLSKWPTELLNFEWKNAELESAIWPPVKYYYSD